MGELEIEDSVEETNLRLSILKGIAIGSNVSVIALKLGVAISVVKRKIRVMRYLRDETLKDAEKTAFKLQASKTSAAASFGSKRFLEMTGLTFQEKTFDNMIHLYRPELLRVLRAKNQYEAIMRLPKSIRNTLRNNKIISRSGKDQGVTAEARRQLI